MKGKSTPRLSPPPIIAPTLSVMSQKIASLMVEQEQRDASAINRLVRHGVAIAVLADAFDCTVLRIEQIIGKGPGQPSDPGRVNKPGGGRTPWISTRRRYEVEADEAKDATATETAGIAGVSADESVARQDTEAARKNARPFSTKKTRATNKAARESRKK